MIIDCAIITIKPNSVQEHHYRIFSGLLNTIHIQYVCDLIAVVRCPNLIRYETLHSDLHIVSKADPIVIADQTPLVGLVDKVKDEVGLKGLEDGQIEIANVIRHGEHVAYCKRIL
jgi:hypothetical protein